MTLRIWFLLLCWNVCVSAQETLYPIQENGKWGFINIEGSVVIRPQFDWDQAYMPENGFIMTGKNDKFGLLSSFGEPLFEPQFDEPPRFHKNIACVKKDGLWGLIQNGRIWLTEPAYETIYDFINGYAKIEKNGKYGLMDSAGTVVIKPEYLEMSYPSEGLVAVDADGGWGYVNLQGQPVIKPRFGSAYDFHGGYALVIVHYNRWKIIDRSGHFTSEKEFDYLGECDDGLFYAQTDTEKGIVNSRGDFVIKNPSGCFYYNRNLIRYEENGKIGFLNLDQRVILKPQFINAGDVGEGWIAVTDVKNRVGFIDSLGRMELEPQSELLVDPGSAFKFSEGRLIVKHQNKFGVIDRNLKWVVKPVYESLSTFRNGWAVFSRGGKSNGIFGGLVGAKYGLIDSTGLTISEAVFDQVLYLGKELAQVQIGSSKAYVDRHGKIIWKQK